MVTERGVEVKFTTGPMSAHPVTERLARVASSQLPNAALLSERDEISVGDVREVVRLLADREGWITAAGGRPGRAPAERQALDALHVWLHHPCGDADLIEACADFHEQRSRRDCQLAEFAVAEDLGAPRGGR